MAGGMDLGTGGKGGKKPLDATINLVPFIDLMAVTISFLIMTAVWTQIGRLQVSQSGGDSPETEQPGKKTPQPPLLVTPTELKLTADQTTFEPYPVSRVGDSGKLDLSKVMAKLRELKSQSPDTQAIILQTEDKVRYEDLVRIIDESIGVGLPNVSVATPG